MMTSQGVIAKQAPLAVRAAVRAMRLAQEVRFQWENGLISH